MINLVEDRSPHVPYRTEIKVTSIGRVLFKKAEVNSFLEKSFQALPCMDGQDINESWQKLFNPRKPWLKFINELALSLPEEVIETKFKKQTR